jgi:hypothetical protein
MAYPNPVWRIPLQTPSCIPFEIPFALPFPWPPQPPWLGRAGLSPTPPLAAPPPALPPFELACPRGCTGCTEVEAFGGSITSISSCIISQPKPRCYQSSILLKTGGRDKQDTWAEQVWEKVWEKVSQDVSGRLHHVTRWHSTPLPSGVTMPSGVTILYN